MLGESCCWAEKCLQTSPDPWCSCLLQSCVFCRCIPIRHDKEGNDLKVLLVSSRGGKGFGLPKVRLPACHHEFVTAWLKYCWKIPLFNAHGG